MDFMESHFEGIAIVVYKILVEFPIPEILRSVPGATYMIINHEYQIRNDERMDVFHFM